MEEGKKIVAIVLAGGQGRRMQSEIPKQYLLLEGKPVLYYSLMAFEQSCVDEIILVTGEEEIAYCRKEIVEKYRIKKVTGIVAGGAERYYSVYAGLKECRVCEVVLIHDGARPFLTKEMIERSIEGGKQYQACILGMPVKDTIKISDGNGYVKETPKRAFVWMVQTPQSFAYQMVYAAYQQLMKEREEERLVTDDAMVVERFSGVPVRLIEGSYENIKITTPEDLAVAGQIARKYLKRLEDGIT